MEKFKRNKDVAATRAAENHVATEATSVDSIEKRRPVQTLREDDVSLSVWARSHSVRGAAVTFWSVTLERSYKDRDGAWRYTHSFDVESLGKIVTLCQRASEFISQQS